MLWVALAGILSGLVMGLVGVGGGAFLVPLLLFGGMTLESAVAIVLFTQLIPQTLPAFWAYRAHFRWREGLIATAMSFVGVTVGAYLVSRGLVCKKMLYRLLAASLVAIGAIVWVKFAAD